ncbi:MAG: GNAT family N-acetyltransferase [Vicinamibacterales bacterium]
MADEFIDTARLRLRRPVASDADEIFARYASDPDVTRYVGFPRHRRLEHTHAFLSFADAHWAQWHTGPYLIVDRASGVLLGGTGLIFDSSFKAATGYILARDAWGRGVATEALGAMVALAPPLGVRRLYAVCHVDHRASARVLEKGGLTLEGVLRRYAEFPNLVEGEPMDVLCYSKVW